MGLKGRMIGLGLMLAAMGTAGAAPAAVLASAQVVEVVQPGYSIYRESVICSGTVDMSHQQELYLSTAVIPAMVYVHPGDYVTAGQVLAIMDYEASRQVAAIPSTNTAIPKLSLDALPAEYLALAGALGMTQESLEAMLLQYVDQGRGSIPVELPKEELTQISTEIIAPTDGLVTQVGLREGVMFPTGAPAFTIGRTSEYVAKITIPEEDLSRIGEGDRVILSGSGLGERQYTGWIRRIYPAASKKLNGTTMATVVEAEVVIDDPDESLKQGLSVEAEVILEDPQQLLTLPYEAVGQDAENREYVYVLEGEIASKRYVITGQELVDQVQILDGISYSDVVIYGGMDQKTTHPILIKGVE